MDNNSKKYPVSLFVIGFILNITKNFFLLIPAIILLIIGIWVKLCLKIGLILLIIDIILSFVEQIRIMLTTLNSSNPNFSEFQNAILSDNWKDNIMNLVEEKIDSNEEDVN